MTKLDPMQLAVAKEFKRLKVGYLARKQFRAWVIEQETPKPAPAIPDGAPIPDYITDATARRALGETPDEVQVAAEVFDKWQRDISDREAKQHAINCSPAGVFAWENSFLEAEQRRKQIVDVRLRQGFAPETIAPIVGYRIEEVVSRKRALGL